MQDLTLYVRNILARGTSAHCQAAFFDAARVAGADQAEAQRAVVDWPMEETLHGVRAA